MAAAAAILHQRRIAWVERAERDEAKAAVAWEAHFERNRRRNTFVVASWELIIKIRGYARRDQEDAASARLARAGHDMTCVPGWLALELESANRSSSAWVVQRDRDRHMVRPENYELEQRVQDYDIEYGAGELCGLYDSEYGGPNYEYGGFFCE